MMVAMKYVVMQCRNIPSTVPIERIFLFPQDVDHSAFARAIDEGGTWKPVRAGVVRMEDGHLYCFGESTTLLLQAKTKDTALLQSEINSAYRPGRGA